MRAYKHEQNSWEERYKKFIREYYYLPYLDNVIEEFKLYEDGSVACFNRARAFLFCESRSCLGHNRGSLENDIR